MGEWPTARLGDVARVVDCEHKTAPAAEPGAEYGFSVGTPHIRNGRIDYASAKRVSLETHTEWSRRAELGPGDLILAREAPVGQVGRVDADRPTCLGQRTVLVRADPACAVERFLHAYLLGRDAQQWMADRSAGSTVAHLNVADVREIPVALPPLDEQRRIAGVLGVLDDLIETERENASTADALWHAVLDHHLGERCELPLSSLAAFVNGRNFTKDASGRGMPVIRTPEIRGGPTESTIRNDAPASVDNIAELGDVLFVWSGSLLVGRWYWESGLINQHIFKVIPNRGAPQWLCHWAIERLMGDFVGVAADKATTMGHIKRADLDREVTVPIPSEWAALDRTIRPLWGEVLDARVHANSLAKIRDELLPLLMSGRVRVREVA